MIDYLKYIENEVPIANNVIKNKYIDYSKNKLKIDIIILIYFYQKRNQRYFFQEFIFNYFIKLKKIFSNYIDFSFTIVGSEEELSKNISNKYFKKNEYFEFAQNYNLNIYDMLSEKVNFGFRKSYLKNTDLLLWFGSNDYVSAHYFTNILQKYNNGYQQYGMTDYLNGKNYCLYIELDNLIFNLNNMYIHDGIHDYCNRQIYKYIGATHGYSRKLLNKFPEILDKINCDEGANEYLVTKIKAKNLKLDINSMKTDNCFFFNVKFGKEEIHSFDVLKEMNEKNIITFKDFKNENYNDYKIMKNNIIYVQQSNQIHIERYIPRAQMKLNNTIMKYILITKLFIKYSRVIKNIKKGYDFINDEMEILINKNIEKKFLNFSYRRCKLGYCHSLENNILDKEYIENNFKLLQNKYLNTVEYLKLLYKNKEINVKIYNGLHLKEIKKFIDNFLKENTVIDYDSWINNKNKVLESINSEI